MLSIAQKLNRAELKWCLPNSWHIMFIDSSDMASLSASRSSTATLPIAHAFS